MAKKDDYLTIRIDKPTKDRLRKLADKHGRTLAGQIIYMIKRAR